MSQSVDQSANVHVLPQASANAVISADAEAQGIDCA